MENKLRQAERGREIWKNLEKKYSFDKYIFMPHQKDEYNDYALLYLDDYLSKERWNSAVIFSLEEALVKWVNENVWKHSVVAYVMDRQDMDDILRFYALYMFSPKATIISLTIPYDTGAENLLGIHGTTKRELLCYDIYRFDEVPSSE